MLDFTGGRFGKLTVVSMSGEYKTKHAVFWRCVCDCGRERIVSSDKLRNGRVVECHECAKYSKKICVWPRCSQNTGKVDLTGKKFNDWTVLKFSDNQKKGRRYWDCECKCGSVVAVSTSNLQSGQSKRCRRCGHWNGHGEISKSFWTHKERSAKIRNKGGRILSFEIKIEEGWNLFLAQERKCVLSGVPLKFPDATKWNGTASLDRIDSKGHYTIGNVQWLHKQVNLMKQQLTNEELICWCEKIVKNIVSNTFNFYQQNKDFPKWMWGCIKKEARVRKIDFQLTQEDLSSLYEAQKGVCKLSGETLVLANKKNRKTGTASLDRIDSTKGYTPDNVQWVHKQVNWMKQSLSDSEFLRWCRLIVSNNQVKLRSIAS